MAGDVDYGADGEPGTGVPEEQAHSVTAHAVTARDGWVRASVKVPGGKLVTAAVLVDDGAAGVVAVDGAPGAGAPGVEAPDGSDAVNVGTRIAGVRFSGDFFMDVPPDVAGADASDAGVDTSGVDTLDTPDADASALAMMARAVEGMPVDAAIDDAGELARMIGEALPEGVRIEGAAAEDFAAAVRQAVLAARGVWGDGEGVSCVCHPERRGDGARPCVCHPERRAVRPEVEGSPLLGGARSFGSLSLAQDDGIGRVLAQDDGIGHVLARDGKSAGETGQGNEPAFRSDQQGMAATYGPWPDNTWNDLPLGVVVPAIIGGASTTSSGDNVESKGTPATSGAYGPAMQMALDEVLAREVAAGRLGPTLRFWEWSEPAVVIGAYQSLHDEVDLAAAQEHGMTVVRRITGGGAMFIEPGNTITYSLYVPAAFVDGLTIAESYRQCDAWLFAALGQLGIDAYPGGMNDIISPAGKIAGAAQRRFAPPTPQTASAAAPQSESTSATSTPTRRARASGAILHHVTMAYDIDAQAMVRVLRINQAKTADKAVKSAVKRVDPLRSQTGLTRAAIIKRLANTLLTGLSHAHHAVIPAYAIDQASALAARRYESDAWTARIA